VAGRELVEVHFAGGATAEQPVDFEERKEGEFAFMFV
jgi:hypothetical protein